MKWTALLVGAYLLGSISWSYLLVRALRGIDVRTVGSGNAGATNVMRASGVLPGIAALVLDMTKGALVVWAARFVDAPDPLEGGAALAVMLGHVFPVFHGFRGGKGVATTAGAFLMLAPLPALIALLVFLLLVLITRYVSLGSIASTMLFVPLTYLFHRLGWTAAAPVWLLVSSAGIAVIVIYKHRENIGRLRRGKEYKLGASRHNEETA